MWGKPSGDRPIDSDRLISSDRQIGSDRLLTKGVRIQSWQRFSHSPIR
ncbi:hypothetical protein RVR34_17035 [Microcystis aeruginosa FBCC-A68]|nr:hypothetical protein [Microcystis aeruginosa]